MAFPARQFWDNTAQQHMHTKFCSLFITNAIHLKISPGRAKRVKNIKGARKTFGYSVNKDPWEPGQIASVMWKWTVGGKVFQGKDGKALFDKPTLTTRLLTMTVRAPPLI